MPMSEHCFVATSQALFAITTNLQSFIYQYQHMNWEQIPSEIPCDNWNQTKVICNVYQDQYIIVPSVQNGSACTGIFNMKAKSWMKLEKDERIAPYNGYLQHLPNKDNKEILLFFGGHEFQNPIRDENIWQFDGIQNGWNLFPTKLPDKLRANVVGMTLLHPNICH